MLLGDEEELGRARLYRLFAELLMQKPSAEVLTEFQEIFQVDINETLGEIEKDFAFLFETEKRLLPYESVYAPMTGGKVSVEVQKLYDSAGLAVDEKTNLAPDHISTELSFMSYLIENGLAEYQPVFLQNHLITWIPLFCDDMSTYAQTGFYKNAANLMKEFIWSEKEALLSS